MADAAPKRMTSDEFLVWAKHQTGRHELHCGEVIAMAPERNRQARVKLAATLEFVRAVRAAGVDCEVFPDGTAVVVDDETTYEPDVLVHCGSEVDLDALTVDRPVVIVEVQSPSSASIDAATKYFGYFRIESVAHYLILDPVRLRVAHHRRGGVSIESAIHGDGVLRLDPPGIEVDVGAFFASL